MGKSKEKLAVNIFSAGRFFLFLLCLSMSCLTGWVIFKLWPRHFETYHLTFIPFLIVEYILISSVALCLAAFIKGGFSKLKRFGDTGLLFCLVILSLWFLFWLILGLVVPEKLVFQLDLGILNGLKGNFSFWLVFWVVIFILYGFVKEFE